MARLEKVASRYAKAIFDSHEQGKQSLKETTEELARFAQIIDGNPELQHVFSTQIFSEEQRQSIVEDLAKKAKVTDGTRRILLVLSEMKRLSCLTQIVAKIRHLILESGNIIPLRVETAMQLSADQKQKVEERFAKLLGKKVEADYVADPALIGGLRVTAAGKTFDGSLSGWLSSFEEQLSETGRV